MAETMPSIPGIWRMYSSLTGSDAPNQRIVIFIRSGLLKFKLDSSILERPHRQALHDRFAHEESEDGNRQDDQSRGGTDAGPVDLAVGNKVKHRHWHGLGFRAGQDQPQHD